MATLTPSYGSVTTHTITLTGLASDTNLVAGRAGTSIDNTSELADDSTVGGFFTSSTTVTPTAAKQVEVWGYGSYDGVTYTGGATGTDANLTPSEKTLMKLITVVPTVATQNKKYEWGCESVARLFGGTMPRKWGIYLVHNMGTGFSVTAANHEVKHTPIKYTSV